jgi:hypothetical protein
MASVTSSRTVISGHCSTSVALRVRVRMKIGTPSWWSPFHQPAG